MSKCYTFIQNYKEGLDLFVIWQRIRLDDEEYQVLEQYVVLTSEYKQPSLTEERNRDCWCR